MLMNASIALAPEGMAIKEAPPFGGMPIYNFDDQQATGFPASVNAWSDAIRAADALLVVTPEYNWSIPGGLKNAIDWASRPYGQNSFNRKPCAVIGTSPGAIGTAVAQQHLRSLLSFCNAPQMNSPEAYIHYRKDMLDDDNNVLDESTASFLHKYMAEFCGFVERCYKALPRPDGKASQAG
jgi:chromate reductase